MDPGKRKYLPNPRENANIFSVLFFTWTMPLFRKGYAKVIELDDVFQPLEVDKSECLGQRLQMWVEKNEFDSLFAGESCLCSILPSLSISTHHFTSIHMTIINFSLYESFFLPSLKSKFPNRKYIFNINSSGEDYVCEFKHEIYYFNLTAHSSSA